MKTKNKSSKNILYYYFFPSILGALFFILIFFFQMFILLEINPPLKIFIIPFFFGVLGGAIIGYWRKRATLLSAEVLNYQYSLEAMINKKTKELELKNKELKTLSFTDSLTGLNNRRRFDYVLEKEWDNIQENKKPLSLIMFDIDRFKQYNDTYGHQKGDECLQRIAHLLHKQVTRANDLVVRYGGEEFCIILPHTHYKDAIIIAEDIRKSIERLHIFHSSSNISSVVTVSIGVSTIQNTKRYKNCSKLIKTADNALYLAKDYGRNRVEGTKIN